MGWTGGLPHAVVPAAQPVRGTRAVAEPPGTKLGSQPCLDALGHRGLPIQGPQHHGGLVRLLHQRNEADARGPQDDGEDLCDDHAEPESEDRRAARLQDGEGELPHQPRTLASTNISEPICGRYLVIASKAAMVLRSMMPCRKSASI